MVAVAVVLFAAGLSAQGKPNFTGKWTLQVDPNAAPPAGGGGGGGRGGGRGGGFGGGFCGAECNITQDATTLKIERAAPAGGTAPAATSYKLDGTETTSTQQMGGNAVESKSKASFDGAKLNITTSTNFNGNARETKMSVWMDGANMVVETTAPGRQGGDPTVTKQTYKKG